MFTKSFRSSAALLLLVTGSLAAQAVPPKGATARCKDATYSTSQTRKGTCSGHGGVAEWLSASGPSAPAPAPAAAPTKPAAPEPTPASGGTKVWVNTASGVYHCPGTRWYGATKQGKYMTESEAKAAGDRPAYGKACG